MMKEEVKNAGADFAKAPQDILQAASDQMWAAIYGAKPERQTMTGSKEKDKEMGYTPLDIQKLMAARQVGDMERAARLQEHMQEKSQAKQENQAAHRAYMQEVERAIQELEMKEEERKKKEAEEEAEERRREEEERAAMQQSSSDGAAKTKGRLGQARPKANVETNFEASKGRQGK